MTSQGEFNEAIGKVLLFGLIAFSFPIILPVILVAALIYGLFNPR
jgi:hypothetical protein